MTDAQEYLRASDIARLTGMSLRTARRWIAKHTVPSVKVSGARLVPRKGLERVLCPQGRPWEDDVMENDDMTVD